MKSHVRKLFSIVLIAVLIVGVYALMMPGEAYAKKPGGGDCGECPCLEEIVIGDLVCWLEACHLLYPYPDCLWDCHYVCPFPF
jgi:hypothetical protein